MIQIQKAQKNDAAGILYVHKKTWLDTYPNNESSVSRADIESKIATFSQSGWENRIEQNDKKQVLVARNDSEIVGFAVGLNEEVQTKIGALYLLQEQQRHGIGTELIIRLFSWMPETKPCRVHVVSYNKPAISFYYKHGFVFEREETEQEWLHFPSGNTMKGTVLKRPAGHRVT